MTGRDYRELRMAARLSQANLAAALGVSSTTVARRERGEQIITAEAELALRRVTGGAGTATTRRGSSRPITARGGCRNVHLAAIS